MATINIRDFVRCVDVSGASGRRLAKGRVYEVVNAKRDPDDARYDLLGLWGVSDGCPLFHAERFEPVQPDGPIYPLTDAQGQTHNAVALSDVLALVDAARSTPHFQQLKTMSKAYNALTQLRRDICGLFGHED